MHLVYMYICIYFQVRVAGLVTTLVNVTGGHQSATNALATKDGAIDTRNGTMTKVSYYTLIVLQLVNIYLCIYILKV